VQQRVEGPRADPVALAGEFFDHAQSENRLFDGVMQHVEADQSRVEITVGVGRSLFVFGIR
jgi:hypothetical protein